MTNPIAPGAADSPSGHGLTGMRERALLAGGTLEAGPDGGTFRVHARLPRRDVRMIRVLIVDDDDLMRAGLRAVLSSDRELEVVGEAADGAEAVKAAGQLAPDVVLMDVRMPGLDGIAATRELLALSPSVRVVILTTFEDDDYVFGGLRAGASGFLLKRTRPEELIEAVHTIAAGDSLLSPSVTRTVIDRMARQPTPELGPGRRLDELTPREREVLELIARGLSNGEIAEALTVEETTVKTHVKRILRKLGLRDRVQAVIYGYESGLVQPAPSGASDSRAPSAVPAGRTSTGRAADPTSAGRRIRRAGDDAAAARAHAVSRRQPPRGEP